ncbi:ectoine/hydroxyectoine ABC transporter substrate-binding protein EhuB [Telmatospirillum sp. J64-1]|uniref:ectoine/hydroxyectoine ABC transporter substrate-binding protein EhuB n=1 Tax=Telmatospirillum sp. J64-1 TaxID=2502183 RepID=UPI00115C6FA4|nr:ectoine/hydroxyectoine ABC transporter substrate-binding protein EhuB [Telmatospirillum sp. J64-1]
MTLGKSLKSFVGAVAMAGAALAATGQASAETTLERIQREGVARIGFANEVPYGYQTPQGEITGEAPEVAKAVLARLGVERVEGVVAEFGALIPGLAAGRFDLIAAGMYVTPARCEQVAFSEPSYAIGEAMAVAEGNPKNIHSFEDFVNNESLRLGVMAGAVEADYARALGVPDSRLVVFPDGPSAVAAVRTGRVDAYAGTALTIQDLVSKTPRGIERAEPFEDPVIDGESVRGYGAFAFRPGDTDFLEAFNRELLAFRGSEEHLALVEPFGFTAAEMPDRTTAELCAQ